MKLGQNKSEIMLTGRRENFQVVKRKVTSLETEGVKTRRETQGNPVGKGDPEMMVFLCTWALVLIPVEEEFRQGWGG